MAIPRWRKVAAAAGVLAAAAALGAAQTASADQPARAHGMSTHESAVPAAASKLSYHGGRISTAPKVYIVYWGNQWGSAGTNGLPTKDPSGEAALQKNFFTHMYGSGDTWSTSTTQYCQGVATGTTNCGTSGTHVGHPAANPVAGTWVDTGTSAINNASQAQIAAEATRAAAHFNDHSGSVQYIIDFPHGVEPSGFAASGGNYCAYHDSVNTSAGTIAYTNMPYMTDAGASCGANFVSTGSSGVNGATEGVTIVGGHEYAETITDQWPSSKLAWVDSSGAENGDKCAWITSGQGASTIVTLNGAKFAVQSLWSNNFNNNTGGCVNSYVSATNQH